jgi:hypothetical protein
MVLYYSFSSIDPKEKKNINKRTHPKISWPVDGAQCKQSDSFVSATGRQILREIRENNI